MVGRTTAANDVAFIYCRYQSYGQLEANVTEGERERTLESRDPDGLLYNFVSRYSLCFKDK